MVKKGSKLNFKDPIQRGINISNAKKGKSNGLLGKKRPPFSDEWRKKLSDAKIGKKRPDEVIRKCVESRKGYSPSQETREKMRIINTGRKMTEEQIRKGVEARKGKPNKNLGRKASDETRIKLSESHRGNKSSFWLGGIAYDPYPPEWNNLLKEKIRKRDNFECRICKKQEKELTGRCKKLHVHHIDYNKNNLDFNNLISLCNSCHQKTSHKRNYWIEYFNKLI